MKTLAELRAMTAAKLPTRTERLCLNLELIERVERLHNEKQDLLIDTHRAPENEDGERQGPPPKMAEGKQPARVDEIDAELADLYAEMREYEGELLLRAVDGATWQAWKDKNPPREGNKSDEDHGYGLVNVAALMACLDDYAAAWNGEEFASGDWSGWFANRVAPGDLLALVNRVVEMHESRITIPKAPAVSSETP